MIKMLLKYFKLELKQGIRLLSYSLAHTILILAVLLGTFWGIQTMVYKEDALAKVNVGFVIPKKEAYIYSMAKLIEGVDSVKSVCNFSFPGQEEYKKQLKDGTLDIVILIPENLYESVTKGYNDPATIIVSENNKLDSGYFLEMLRSGERILQIAQTGVYALDDVRLQYEFTSPQREMEKTVSDLYLTEALNRVNTFETVEISIAGQYSLSEFKLSCGILLVIIVGCISYVELYKKEEQNVLNRLKIYGVNPVMANIIRVLNLQILICISAIIFLVIAMGVSITLGLGFDFCISVNILLLIPLSITLAICIHFVYSMGKTQSFRVLLLLCFSLVMLIFSGSLFPTCYLPDCLENIYRINPFYYWQQMVAGILFGN